jgi:hypothetical protein
LTVSIQAAYTNVAVGFALNFTATLGGRATANRWNFGDGTIVSNRTDASHSWAVAGDYSVVFQAYNDTNPGGISATVTVQVVAQPIHYVVLDSANPVAPYTSWATAATNIQDVVDAASVAGALVLVTNGIYRTGERVTSEIEPMTNRVAVTKAITVRSVNGAAVTVIHGQGAVRCVYLASGAALVGFTLANSFAENAGAGVWCASASALVSNCVLTGNSTGAYGSGGGASGGTLYNCTLTGNSAGSDGGPGGGGAVYSTLYNCMLTRNSAGWEGGGAAGCTLNNCTLTGNSSPYGGGASDCTLNNCIVYYNSAPNGTNGDNSPVSNYLDSFLSYSCSTPLPTDGIANFTNAPLFMDYPGGNLRLQSNSPCINSGFNASAPAGLDLDGNPRIVGGTVDIGAYEFQSPQSRISYAWLQQYGLPTDGSADYADPDHDGMNNWQEWRCGTSPTDASSALRLLSAQRTGTNVTVTWQSVAGVNYFLERSMNLGASVVHAAGH